MWLDRTILILGWVGVGMLIIDQLFFVPVGPFLANFTWLSKYGAILGGFCFMLLGIRKFFIKKTDEPKWKQ